MKIKTKIAKVVAEESAYVRMTEDGEMFENLYPVFEQTKSAAYASSPMTPKSAYRPLNLLISV